jgi:hypothetical protein
MAAERFSGGCQCGAVRYEVTADLDQSISCNCSRCARLGAVLTFAPVEAFTLLAGDGAMTDYQFNHRVIHHLFCATCGIESFARGKGPDGVEMVAINVRCLDGVDVDALTPARFDGRNL